MTAAVGFRCGRGPSTPLGTGILSPDAQDVTARGGGVWWWMHRSWEGCFVSGTGVGQDVRRDAVARVVAGESASAVGRVLGYRRGTVSRWCQAAGVELVRGSKGGTLEADQARRAKVVQAVLAGQTVGSSDGCATHGREVSA